MFRLRVRLVAVALALFTGLSILAQTERGTITGTVSDQAKAVIPNATLEAGNLENGAQYQTITTTTGNYTLPELPAGTYDITVSVTGFEKFV